MFGFESLFVQVAAALTVAVVLGLLATLLKQPLIVAFIATGILVGPEASRHHRGAERDRAAGRDRDLAAAVRRRAQARRPLVRKLGPVALATGVGQVVFTSVFGFVIARALGFDTVPALYIAVALTFSSTIIIVKLLTDKRELDDLHGRIAIGFLIVQDIGVVLAMIAITAFDGRGQTSMSASSSASSSAAGRCSSGSGSVMRWVRAPARCTCSPGRPSCWSSRGRLGGRARGGRRAARLQRGGRGLPGRDVARVDPLPRGHQRAADDPARLPPRVLLHRLGTPFELRPASSQLGRAPVLAVRADRQPAIVMVIMGADGYRKKVSFKAGLTVAQISEFSLILVALGASLGQVDEATCRAGHRRRADHHLGVDLHDPTAPRRCSTAGSNRCCRSSSANPDAARPEDERSPEAESSWVSAGSGATIARGAAAARPERARCRLRPPSVRSFQQLGVPVVYGDAEDPELAAALPLSEARWVVSTVRGVRANLSLLQSLRDHHFAGRIALSADSEADVARLEAAGADLVLHPFRSAAAPIVGLLVES
jgi:Kef-type K+ transport system membrane component KefB